MYNNSYIQERELTNTTKLEMNKPAQYKIIRTGNKTCYVKAQTNNTPPEVQQGFRLTTPVQTQYILYSR